MKSVITAGRVSIGKKVYVIYDDSIELEHVGYIGSKSFIIEDFYNKVEDAIEYFYDDYGQTWFTNFSDAEKQIIKDFDGIITKPKLVKKCDGYWVLEEKEE